MFMAGARIYFRVGSSSALRWSDLGYSPTENALKRGVPVVNFVMI